MKQVRGPGTRAKGEEEERGLEVWHRPYAFEEGRVLGCDPTEGCQDVVRGLEGPALLVGGFDLRPRPGLTVLLVGACGRRWELHRPCSRLGFCLGAN